MSMATLSPGTVSVSEPASVLPSMVMMHELGAVNCPMQSSVTS